MQKIFLLVAAAIFFLLIFRWFRKKKQKAAEQAEAALRAAAWQEARAEETARREQLQASMTSAEWGLYEFTSEGWALPRGIPAELMSSITRYGTHCIGTENVDRLEDYMLWSAEYLEGDIPDQFCLSGEQYSYVSMALSLRLAVGSVAMLIQATVQPGKVDGWNQIVAEVEKLLDMIPSTPSGVPKSRKRDLILIYSDFRTGFEHPNSGKPPVTLGQNGFRLLMKKGSSLEVDTSVCSWEDVADRITQLQ